MQLRHTYRIILWILAALWLGACQRVVITVDTVPANTPANQPLYIVGNFNNWDPGDERFQMVMNSDSTWSIELPPGFGTVEYKFTRGDWTTVEKDICGYEVDNRQAIIGDQDTVVEQIASWNDLDPLNCPRLTLLVKDVPEDTPEDEILAIAGNFNRWSVDSTTELKKDSSGSYSITIDRPPDIEEIEFKMTRGDLASAESDEFGNMIPNRVLRFGIKDTVEIKVEGWIDQPRDRSNRVMIIIDGMPPNTPSGDDFFLACSMNGWSPGDKNYMFQRNRQGQLFFPIPRRNKPLEFKVTRGSWRSVEVDRYGYEIANRYVDLVNTDTLIINVDGWKDRQPISDFDVVVIVDEVPSTTPEDDELFITGNFNGWNPGRLRYAFERTSSGEYAVTVPRGKGDLVFKITRGSWESAEVDRYGSDLSNRVYAFKDIDTVYVAVENWKDLPPYQSDKVTLVIDKMPDYTPQLDNIYLAPDFNGWNPGDPNLVFYYLPDGRPYLTIKTTREQMEYKITRGNWETVEVESSGYTIDDRLLTYGFSDTVYIEIKGWRDFIGTY